MSWRDRIANAILGGKVGGPTPTGIHVYHSSPHDFDRFDLGKIGTGEGAQVYGHGIYAAENPAVSGQGGQYWQQFMGRHPPDEQSATKLLQQHGFDRAKAMEDAQKHIETMQRYIRDPANAQDALLPAYERGLPAYQRQLDLLQSGAPVGPRTYEVNFRARPEELLDWDKPLSAQAPGTREALAKLGVPDAPHVKGEQAYWHLKGDMLQRYGHRDPNLNAAYTSQVLNEAGIPGIRYLDEGSRGIMQKPFAVEHVSDPSRTSTFRTMEDAQRHMTSRARAYPDEAADYVIKPRTGTSNYVAFDPSKLDIMAKYGVVGGVPLGALAATDQYGVQP